MKKEIKSSKKKNDVCVRELEYNDIITVQSKYYGGTVYITYGDLFEQIKAQIINELERRNFH